MPHPVQTPDPRIVALPAAEIRRRFVDFFAERGHAVVPSASLVPAGDQTLLFTNSGMVQFKDVLTGASRRARTRAPWTTSAACGWPASTTTSRRSGGRRATTPSSRCSATGRFGDYFKREAIHWAWEFLTRDLGIPGDRLAATTYTDDEVAWAIWRDEIGLPPERMARWGDVDHGDDHNFWRMADTGPCGPCSEIHFDRGRAPLRGPGLRARPQRALPALARDLEPRVHGVRPAARTAACRCRSRASTPGWASSAWPASSSRSPPTTTRTCSRRSTPGCASCSATTRTPSRAERFSYQVIADHSRAVTFLIADGVLPSNEGRGYVLRRIFRRAVRHGRLLGRREPFLAETAAVVIEVMGDAYPHLVERRDEILAVIAREEAQFARTLDAGTGQLEEALTGLDRRGAGRRPPARGPARRRAAGSPGDSPSGSTTPTASRST